MFTARRMFKALVALILCLGVIVGSTVDALAWRKTSSRTINGYTLYARADLPYFSDLDGGGNWAAQAAYAGPKNNNKLTLDWSFYCVGGSVSYNGVGVSGSGTSPGSSLTLAASTINASGRVYGNGLCLYVGLNVTSSFVYGNSYYSTTAHI
jgi:hypothetical protein